MRNIESNWMSDFGGKKGMITPSRKSSHREGIMTPSVQKEGLITPIMKSCRKEREETRSDVSS